MKLHTLTDEQLLLDTKRLALKEREIMIEVLHHLLEVNVRKVFSPKYKTLFDYARQELGYSEDQASRRLDAMRLLAEIPEIESKVASAELSLTAMGLAQTHFRNEHSTREEKLEILEAIEGKSTREAMRELIKRSSEPCRMKPETVRPVSETLNEVRLYLNDEALDKISKLKGRLAHKHPHLSTSELFVIALDLALKETDPAREPKRRQPKQTPSSEPVNDVTTEAAGPTAALRKRAPGKALRRQVFRESEDECALCGSHRALEVDHQAPFALGGLTIKENLRVLCRNCNARERIKTFG